MLSCREVMDELAEYLYEDVAADLRRELEAHLQQCRTCNVLYDSTRKTLRVLTDSRCFELPVDLSARIMAKIRNSKEEPA